MKRHLPAVIGAVLATALLTGAVLAGTNHPADPQPDLVFRGGAIRLGVGGPDLYTASNHSSIGVVSVAANAAGDLVITTDFASDEKLVSALVDEDFQTAVKRTICGISGGGTTITIRCTKPDGSQAKVNSSFFNIAIDNLWFQTMSVKS